MSDEPSELTLCAGGGGKVFRLSLMQGLQPVEDIPNELDHVPRDIAVSDQIDIYIYKNDLNYIYIYGLRIYTYIYLLVYACKITDRICVHVRCHIARRKNVSEYIYIYTYMVFAFTHICIHLYMHAK